MKTNPRVTSSKNLTHKVIASLRSKITSGRLSKGDKLPTEKQLVEEFKVSRTVVREALAALKSDGLLISRQGSGFFISDDQVADTGAKFVPNVIDKISDMLEMFELRLAVEVESAGLAAIRKSPAQEESIYVAFQEYQSAVAKETPSHNEDRALHLAIANATNNSQIIQFYHYFKSCMAPRGELLAQSKYDIDTEQQILKEHTNIVDAIMNAKEEEARDAMRKHLKAGIERYKTIRRGLNKN